MYGGPGSQTVTERRRKRFQNHKEFFFFKSKRFNYMVETYGIAIAGIDPVGTGYQGAEKMFRLNIYSPRYMHI